MPARFEDIAEGAGRYDVLLNLQSQNNMIKDDIVISGFSGRFPESSNVEEFMTHLLSGVDMVNEEPRRWPNELYDLPARLGKMKDKDLESFDLQFFGVHNKQAEYMDPQARALQELTHEALIDAGKSNKNIFDNYVLLIIIFTKKP